MTTITFAMRTASEANMRENRFVAAARHKEQKRLVRMVLDRYVGAPTRVPTRVTFTRYAPGMLDSDNLQGSMKYPRDSVARWAGVDDGPKGPIAWAVLQEKAKNYATRIEIVRRA